MSEGASGEGSDPEPDDPLAPPGEEPATPPASDSPRPALRIAPRPARPDHITKLPGINYLTKATGSSNIGPGGVWKARAGRLIGSMWNKKAMAEFAPFLREAENWLQDAMMQLALASGGICGPIEANALATAAWQTAYARYWMHLATENPSDTKMFETASRVADAARSNSLAAYDIAVRLARSRPSDAADPLANFVDVQAPSPPLPASQKKTTKKSPGFADDDE